MPAKPSEPSLCRKILGYCFNLFHDKAIYIFYFLFSYFYKQHFPQEFVLFLWKYRYKYFRGFYYYLLKTCSSVGMPLSSYIFILSLFSSQSYQRLIHFYSLLKELLLWYFFFIVFLFPIILISLFYPLFYSPFVCFYQKIRLIQDFPHHQFRIWLSWF